MKIALGSDHRGADAVRTLVEHLRDDGHETVVLGPDDGEACDYPDSAWLVGHAVAAAEADCGVLICGSGIGMSMAANKIPGVRAALVFDSATAEMTRRHNDANILCLSAGSTPVEQMPAILDIFLAAGFDAGRHERRVEKLSAIERGEDPSPVPGVTGRP